MPLTQSQQAYYDGDNFGGYQVTSLQTIIDNFLATYVGEGKLLQNTLAADVSFHAHRALQELSFDTLKSCKSQEIEIPPSLTMPLPQDYVNYVKLSWVDSSGIKHIIYPTSKTSNPKAILQDSAGDYNLTAVGTLVNGSDTVVLDASYTNILVGMTVSSPNIVMTKVETTSTVGGITTITVTVPGGATYTGTETLSFSSPPDLLAQEANSLVLTGLTWTSGEDKITATSTTGIEVGMLVSHEDFAVGTTVIDVNGLVITTSTNATATETSGNVNFVSYEPISDTWSNYKSATPSENQDDYQDDTYWPAGGSRFGLDPQHAQANGSFYMDCSAGKIHFSSNISGKTVILEYISDGHGTTEEMVVHKFAEEAMYKWIAYGCLSARIDVPEYVINRYKKERFATTRKAKLRLSNIKLEELTQILRGKSKQIKH
tara:strand:+ start:844 stop:2133 length:1290 start_codon:yes stop_codon:yes gene_type:complete